MRRWLGYWRRRILCALGFHAWGLYNKRELCRRCGKSSLREDS